jgi:hypothetical protein
MKDNKIVHKIKDILLLLLTAVLIMTFLLIMIYLQMQDNKPYLNIGLFILLYFLFLYESYVAVSKFMKKGDKQNYIIYIGVFINSFIIGAYLVVIIIYRIRFNIGLVFHGLIITLELLIFRAVMKYIIKNKSIFLKKGKRI